jgi:hypothetical protein
MEPMVQTGHHILIVEQAEVELVGQERVQALQLIVMEDQEELVLMFFKLVLQDLKVALDLYLGQNIFLEEVEEQIHLADLLLQILKD